MRPRIRRGTLVGSSDLKEKLEALKRAKEEFVNSELKSRLDKEWDSIQASIEHKRPRIERPPRKVRVSVGGFIEVTIDYGEWCCNGRLGTIIEKIY